MNKNPVSRKDKPNINTLAGRLPPYDSLRVAVIERAIKDFKEDVRKAKKSKKEITRLAAIDDMKSIIAFFQSQYFELYAPNVNADVVFENLITEEVENILKS